MHTATRPSIGFAGLGLMGSRMAGRLLDCGFSLSVWNRTAAKTEPLARRGARVAASPADLARGSDIVATMLADPDALLGFVDAATSALEPHSVFVDMSTVGPAASREAARRTAARGVAFVDAPVLGSIAPAASGELLVFAGGALADVERARPVLDALAKRVIHCGSLGSGSALKIVANLVLCRMVELLGEALALGVGQGIPGSLVLEMLDAGVLASPMWKRGTALLAADPPLHFPVRHAVKDLRLAEEAAAAVGVQLPGCQQVRAVFEDAAARGQADADYSVVVRDSLAQARRGSGMPPAGGARST